MNIFEVISLSIHASFITVASFYLKKKKMKVTQSCPILCDPHGLQSMEFSRPRILEWVAFPFSRRSSQPRGRTQVSHIADGFFTSWATREAYSKKKSHTMLCLKTKTLTVCTYQFCFSILYAAKLWCVLGTQRWPCPWDHDCLSGKGPFSNASDAVLL